MGQPSTLTTFALALAICATGVRAGKPADACARLKSDDTIIAVCLQNDFFDERPADGSYAPGAVRSYDIPETDVHGATVRRGALAVGRSEEVVPVANEWMRRMDEAGGTVITTLDWHPPEHCSFCRSGKISTSDSTACGGATAPRVSVSPARASQPRCSTPRPLPRRRLGY